MDAEPDDDIFTGRMLRRAENISGDNEQRGDDADDDPLAHPGRRVRRTNTFGFSIMRKLQEVKSDATRLLGRSRSLGGRSAAATTVTASSNAATDAVKNRRGHAHSLSDVHQELRPQGPVHSESAPAALSDNHRRALSDVQEQVMSPSVEEPPPPPLKPAEDVVVPQLLQLGTPMTKVSAKTHKKAVFRLDADLGQIVWESKQHKIIPIETIKEIRTGSDARYYREQFQLSQDYEDRWLTIVYILDGNYKTLHLIVATKDVFKMWETTLRQLHAIRKELMTGLGNLEMRQALWEKQYWKGADEERDQKLSFDEVEKLCKRLNINSSQDDLRRLFQQADDQRRGYLDFDDFRRFVKLLKGRPEVHRLYNKLKARNGGDFDYGVFELFMREKQKSTLAREELEALFQKYAKLSTTMSLEAFNSFLLSPDNAVFSDQHAQVHHDMTLPLSEYFISSSHNTYLVGHQLVGDSTIEGYIRALLHSCRSVEVDIYDGDVEPMIFHGKTFTSKVSLREVCEAIKKYGFVASPYPIIISAEVHCSLPHQDMIAKIMISVFGDALVRENPDSPISIEALPSPEELKGKILLKTKNLFLSSSSDATDSDSSFTDQSSTSASESEFFAEPIGDVPSDRKKRRPSVVKAAGVTVLQRVKSIGKHPPSATRPPASPRTTSAPLPSSKPPSTPFSARRLSESAGRPHSAQGHHPPKPKMSLALVALLVYTVGVKCRGLNKKEHYAPEHMFSLSETMTNKMIKVGMMDLIKHTRSHLVRIYPKGTRVSSSNYEPHRFWATGAQLVALNWQTFDLGYMINHAMFQRNGRSGFVLKPLALRAPSKDLLLKRTQHVLQATIISAQQLPRPKNALGHEIMSGGSVHPYVEVALYVPDWPAAAAVPGVSRSNSRVSARANVMGRKRDSGLGMLSPRLASLGGSSTSVVDGNVATSEKEKEVKGSTAPQLSLGGHGGSLAPPSGPVLGYIPGRTISFKTSTVKNNGFNPVWEEKLTLPFECVGDMMDLVFVRFVVRRQDDKEGDEPLAVYCASLGSLGRGYRHLPLHDSQLSQFLFSTLFVRIHLAELKP
ncbi:phosphoinositide-specific phospholipase C [Ephemerocybe angulata]|uniref:Phosphoinositide phospholipase C n=1 Tax=Ephemerocybe angulata TaxID=980116 RepID=A0A8H6I5P6_9AGAR|nr:phosphoinositide-specific phospholipase C [Tulosesus angulatus]